MFTPVILHIPHSSTFIPPEYRSYFLADAERELLYMTDWHTDGLFSCRHESVVFPVTRLICDVERFRDEKDEIMASRGMGAVYERAHDLTPLRIIGEGEREAILARFYDPHHRRLERAVEERLSAFGRCLIIDCHSFYPEPLPYELSRERDRPDFCIGTDRFHTPEGMGERLAAHLRGRGVSAKLNSPFSGALVPLAYYGKDKRVKSVMIEVNRRLYLTGSEKTADFAHIRDTLAELMELAAETAQGDA